MDKQKTIKNFSIKQRSHWTKILRDKLVTKRKEMNLKIAVRNLSEIQLRIPEKHDLKEPLRERQWIKASNMHVKGVSKEENGGKNI